MIHPLYILYTLIGGMFFVLVYPFAFVYAWLAKDGFEGLHQRLGRYPAGVRNMKGSPRIWIHAASVGEVRVAASMIPAFKSIVPECAVILSTMTQHGRAFAKETVGDAAACVYVPLDFIFSVRRALEALCPDAFVSLETEIWPHLFIQAKKRGVVTAILNGRISGRNYKGYRRLKPLFRAVLGHVDVYSMISASDAGRMMALGARPDRVAVNGNAKFDGLGDIVDKQIPFRVRQRLHLAEDQPVFVAGSTRRNEALLIAEAYGKICQAFPKTVLVLAPRHIERVPAVVGTLHEKGFECRLLTDLDADMSGKGTSREIIVINTMGELLNIYSVATLVFCGGSLVPLGGQNVLEPAAWGVPVLYGPYMDDFNEAKEMLESTGGGIEVKDAADLAGRAMELLANPEKARRVGNAARAAVQSNTRAAEKHARLVCDRLS